MIYTVIEEDLSVYKMDIADDNEIPALIDSGFVAAVIWETNDGIVYAKVDWEEYTVEWTKPVIRKEGM